MRIITLVIIHCSATPQGVRLSFDDCRREHIRRGFSDIGYHFYITRNGEIHRKHPIKYTLYFHKIENSISTLVKS